jgi:glycogen synthase kinase 3 beta
MSTLSLGVSDSDSSPAANAKSWQNEIGAPPEYRPVRVVGQGVYGVVYAAKTPSGEIVAIKKVLQDSRFKNRELEILQMLRSEYCVSLKSYFRTVGKQHDIYLNLAMDYLPLTLHQFNMGFREQRKFPPLLYMKLFGFELFSGLAYLHSQGICHRDIRPQNILVDPETGELKICDFGCAKVLKPEERSVSNVGAVNYRAPELLFDCQRYGFSIDIWAAACTIAEILNAGVLLFPEEGRKGHLASIVKILGPLTESDLHSFVHTISLPFPEAAETTLKDVLPKYIPDDVLDLLTKILVYNPSRRPTAKDCLKHPCFTELFTYELAMPGGHPFPKLAQP